MRAPSVGGESTRFTACRVACERPRRLDATVRTPDLPRNQRKTDGTRDAQTHSMINRSAVRKYLLATCLLGLPCACGGANATVASSSTGPDAGDGVVAAADGGVTDESDAADATPGTTPTADYEKQHTLLLVGELPPPGQMGIASVYTVRGDGTGKTLLANDAASPSWTPDGKVIFISSRSGSQQIWLMDADGSNARQVGNLPPFMLPLMPQLGRNGLIAFMGADPTASPDAGGDTNAGLWVMQQDGSGLRQLTSGMQPFLAISGKWIAYTLQTDSPYHREIWRINTDGTGKKQLTFLGDDADYPDGNAPNISPDESTVAFFSGKESDRAVPGAPQQSILDWGHRNVAIVPATGGARKTLTPCHPVTTQAEFEADNDCIAADNPAWSPDGKWLICDTGFRTGTKTFMVDVTGQGFQELYSESRGIVRVALKQR